MKKVNTHGIKMVGLKAASGNTCNWAGHTQISYDMSDGQILTDDIVENNSWVQYHSPDIITVTPGTNRHMTMQEIADLVAEAVSFENMVSEHLNNQ